MADEQNTQAENRPKDYQMVAPTAVPAKPDLGKTSMGLRPNLAAVFAYTLGLVSGLVFFLLEKENKFVRFHAMQSICFSVTLFLLGVVVSFIPVVGPALVILLDLAGLAIWVVFMINAYRGEWFRLPVIGDFAAKQVGLSPNKN